MKLEHQIRIDAPKSRVEAFLDDFERAALCLPGVEEVKPLGDGEYEGRLRVRVGPLGFNMSGRARPERTGDGAWRVHGEGRDARIGASAKAALIARSIEVSESETEVQISADMQFTGALAGLGQPLIKKKADSMVHEFAQNLRRALSTTPS